jgi:hypothetical protein
VKRLLIALLCAAIATGAFAQLSPTIPTSTVQVWMFRESAVAPPVSTSGYAKLYVDTNGDAWYSKNGGAFAKLPFAASTFVASFNGRTGTVVPTTGDYSVAQVTGAESSAHAASTYAPIASPTFTGTVTIPSPFTLGATSITVTGTEINRRRDVRRRRQGCRHACGVMSRTPISLRRLRSRRQHSPGYSGGSYGRAEHEHHAARHDRIRAIANHR